MYHTLQRERGCAQRRDQAGGCAAGAELGAGPGGYKNQAGGCAAGAELGAGPGGYKNALALGTFAWVILAFMFNPVAH